MLKIISLALAASVFLSGCSTANQEILPSEPSRPVYSSEQLATYENAFLNFYPEWENPETSAGLTADKARVVEYYPYSSVMPLFKSAIRSSIYLSEGDAPKLNIFYDYVGLRELDMFAMEITIDGVTTVKDYKMPWDVGRIRSNRFEQFLVQGDLTDVQLLEDIGNAKNVEILFVGSKANSQFILEPEDLTNSLRIAQAFRWLLYNHENATLDVFDEYPY